MFRVIPLIAENNFSLFKCSLSGRRRATKFAELIRVKKIYHNNKKNNNLFNFGQICTKVLMKYKQPKMKRDARQRCLQKRKSCKYWHFNGTCWYQQIRSDVTLNAISQYWNMTDPLSISTWFLKYRVSFDLFFNLDISILKT